MAQQLIESGDIIIGSLKNFRKNLAAYSEFVVWFALLSIVYWAFMLVTRALIPDKTLRIFAYLLFSIPMSLVLVILTVAIIDVTAKSLQKKKIDVRASLYQGAHKLIPIVWVSFLTSLMIAGGFILFVVPALIFFVWYKFSSYEVVMDDVGGTAALGASRRLVTGRWWAVFVRLLVPGVFFYLAVKFSTALIYLLVGAIMGDPGLFFGPIADLDTLPNSHMLFITVVPQIITGFSLPLFLCSDLILWYDLKRTS